MKLFSTLPVLSLLIITAWTTPAWAAAPKTPVQIEADQMQANQNENSVFFSGRVEAKQEGLTIHADEMTVYYSAGKAPTAAVVDESNKEIKRLLAKGHVEITKENWVATGKQAEYFSDERKVVITGDTKVWQNNNLVTGNTVVLYLDEGKSIVERGTKKGDRVKAFFYPDAKKP